MKIKFLHSNKWYPIDDGFTYIKNFNETLDNAEVRVSHLENEIDIEPLDKVVLLENDGTTKFCTMCVDKFTLTQEAIGQNDTTFSYSISLFSLTKLLEGIVLPNLSITPRKLGNKLSILQYARRVLSTYGPKDRDGNSIWSFSQKFIDKFTNVDCPEMQWTTPTLRELLNDLTMLKDCIVLLNDDDKISILDLTEINDANDKSYNLKTQTRTSDDYISEIRMELQNVMQTNVSGINNVVTTAEYLTLTSDESIITSENCYLKTQFPILNIRHLWLYCFAASVNDDATTIIKIDLCNFRVNWGTDIDPVDASYSLIYEKKEYDSKNVLYRSKIPVITAISTPNNDKNGEFYSSYRNFCLYFTRNSNRIEGFSDLSKALFAAEHTTLEYLKLFCACYNANSISQGLVTMAKDINEGINSYFSTFFQIEYETTYNAVFQASKGDVPRNRRVIADNQTNAWVDAYSQGFLEYQKANRLGNLQVMYNQRVENKNDLYEISDYIGDDIVYRTEYQIYPDHIECNAHATKNFVLRDYFTGIKSKIRTWVNAQDEAFIRHDLKKYYCELDYTINNDSVEDVNTGKNLAYYLLSSLYATNDIKPIKYVLINTQSTVDISGFPSTSYYPANNTSKFALNCITRLVGNSIVLTTGFNDNWIVDKHPNAGTRDNNESYNDTGIIIADDIEPLYISTNPYADYHFQPPHFKYDNAITLRGYGGITTDYYKYCDNNGEFDFVRIFFLDSLQVSDSYLTTNDAVKQLFIDYYNMPAIKNLTSGNVPLNTYNFGFGINYYKDNKEKPVISTQFEFISTQNDIAFTNLFVSRQDMIRDIAKSNLKGYISNTFNKTDIPSDATLTTMTLDIDNVNDYCASVTATTTGSGKYLYVCDNDDNLILVFDKTKTLYLNIRRFI